MILGCGASPPAPTPAPAPSTEEAAAAEEEVAPEAETPTTPEEPAIVERLLPFDDERKTLTVAYREAHQGTFEATGDLEADTSMEPQAIVLHWTAGETADSAWNTFAPTRLPGRPDLVDAGAVNVSAHYLVDRDGSISRLMPDTRVGRHVIGLNHLAIGIENVGGTASTPLTEAQVAANIALVRHLDATWPTIAYLFGHHEYRRMETTPLFEEQDPNYRTTKPDPGPAFMAAVRAGVSDLDLQAPPEE